MTLQLTELFVDVVMRKAQDSPLIRKLLQLPENRDPYHKSLESAIMYAGDVFLRLYDYDDRYQQLLEWGIIKNPQIQNEFSKLFTTSETPDVHKLSHWEIRDDVVDDFDLPLANVQAAIQVFFDLVESALSKSPALRDHFNSRSLHRLLTSQQDQLYKVQANQEAGKPLGEHWLFPQIQSVDDPLLKEHLERSVELLNIKFVDMGLFSLAKLFETELKQLLIAAMQSSQAQVSANDLRRLANMIDCAVSNNVLSSKNELHFLRKERNKRAHDDPPPIAERKQLMRWSGFLGDHYIKYILAVRAKFDALQQSAPPNTAST